MCGAFSIVLALRWWGELYGVPSPDMWQPVYNARPGKVLPIITEEAPAKVTEAVWSFVPHWMKDPKKGVINARAEGIETKPFFRASMKSKRCVIPADGFYEWDKRGKLRVPYRFVRKDGKPFAFAGVYDDLPDNSGNVGFAIITTEANPLVAKVHDRMPVMFDEEWKDEWLDPDTATDRAAKLLRPYPAGKMKMFEVSRRVNIAKNKEADVIEPVA